jgi:hypothetical protein
MRERGGGGAWGGVGAPGAHGSTPDRAGLGWAGSGWVAGRDESPQHTRPLIGIQRRIKNPKQGEMDARSNTTSNKKYASA